MVPFTVQITRGLLRDEPLPRRTMGISLLIAVVMWWPLDGGATLVESARTSMAVISFGSPAHGRHCSCCCWPFWIFCSFARKRVLREKTARKSFLRGRLRTRRTTKAKSKSKVPRRTTDSQAGGVGAKP